MIESLKIDILISLEELESTMNEQSLMQVRHFVQYNELKLAIEFLCEYISEDEIHLEPALKSKINGFCALLDIDKIYWLDSDDPTL
jgi:hypothetical protein